MTVFLGIEALKRLRRQELYGLKKLLFRALTCPTTNPADLPAIRATLAAIEAELADRRHHPAPSL